MHFILPRKFATIIKGGIVCVFLTLMPENAHVLFMKEKTKQLGLALFIVRKLRTFEIAISLKKFCLDLRFNRLDTSMFLVGRSRAICAFTYKSYVSEKKQTKNFYKVEAASKDFCSF